MKRDKRPGRPSPLERFLEANRKPAGRYISRLRDVLTAEPDVPLLLLNRVSTRRQAKDGHLEDDRKLCLEQLAGCNVVKQLSEVGSGKLGPHRSVLREAIEWARRHGAVLVAFSRDRLIRGRDYDGTNESDEPTEDEYAALVELAVGVRLATILPPYKRGRSAQVKRGQQARGKKGGRPPKKTPGWRKRLTKKKLPLVIASMKQGYSVRQTAAMHDVKPPTVHLWWTEYKNRQKTVHPDSTT